MSGFYGGSGPRPIEYLFVDGAYLKKSYAEASRQHFNNEPFQMDFRKLAGGFTKVFYYDCLAPRDNGEGEEEYGKRIDKQKEFHNELRQLPGFHVYEGTTSGVGGKARQKQVDIMIAVHILLHTIRGNMQKTTLLAGDLDFKPVVDALVQEGMYVTLWYEPRSASKNLIYAADAQKIIDARVIWQMCSEEFKSRIPEPVQLQ